MIKFVLLLLWGFSPAALPVPWSYSGNIPDDEAFMLSPGDGEGLIWMVAAFYAAGVVAALVFKAADVLDMKDAGAREIFGMALIYGNALFILLQLVAASIVMWPLAIIAIYLCFKRWSANKKKDD